MRSIHRSIDIDAPVERVFEFVTDPNNLPGVWPNLQTVRNVEAKDGGVRDYDWEYKMAGIHFHGHAHATVESPNEYLEVKNDGGIPSTFHWHCEPKGGGTCLLLDVDYRLPVAVIGKLAEAAIAKINERDADRLLSNIKKTMEARARVEETAHAMD